MCATGVEVSQQRAIVFLIWLARLLRIVALRIDVIRDDQFDGRLGAAVWIRGANRAVLWDGDHVLPFCRVAVHCRGGGEDDVWDVILVHAAEEDDGAIDIDAVVFEGFLGRFSNCLQNLLAIWEGFERNLSLPSMRQNG